MYRAGDKSSDKPLTSALQCLSRHLSVQGQLARNLNRGLYQKTAPYRYQVLSMKEGRKNVGRVKLHKAVENRHD